MGTPGGWGSWQPPHSCQLGCQSTSPAANLTPSRRGCGWAPREGYSGRWVRYSRPASAQGAAGLSCEYGCRLQVACPTLDRYSSVQGHLGRVLDLRSVGEGAVSVSSGQLCLHASGGVPRVQYKVEVRGHMQAVGSSRLLRLASVAQARPRGQCSAHVHVVPLLACCGAQWTTLLTLRLNAGRRARARAPPKLAPRRVPFTGQLPKPSQQSFQQQLAPTSSSRCRSQWHSPLSS
jgi:hypothetical protein